MKWRLAALVAHRAQFIDGQWILEVIFSFTRLLSLQTFLSFRMLHPNFVNIRFYMKVKTFF